MFQRNGVKALAFFAAASVLAGSASAANNVLTWRDGGELNVLGDIQNNSIIIEQANGSLFVRGTSGTTVNGKAFEQFPGFVPENVVAAMGPGNDTIRLQNLYVREDLDIDLGAGNDVIVTPAPVRVDGNFSVVGQEGTDIVRLLNVQVGEDLHFDGGGGSCTADFNHVTVGNSITINGGPISDLVTISNTTCEGSINVDVQGGDDRVRFNTVEAEDLSIDLGSGNDIANVWYVQLHEDFDLSAGSGNDTVDLFNLVAGANVSASLDEGNDYLRATNVLAESDLEFNGGDGFDTFSNRGNVFAGEDFNVDEFEVGG